MPTQLHAQARMMQFLAIVTSLVSFFRCLGGILALTIMSSVVNNKISDAFTSSSLANSTSNSSSSSLNSLGSIQSLPPDTLIRVQDAFSDAIRWAYIALLPFVCIAAISAFFLREVKIERSVEDEQRREAERNGDGEMGTSAVGPSTAGQSGVGGGSAVVGRKPRIKIYGPFGAIIWCCQAIGDKMGWRK
jgi:CBS domain containing-hemolysin-like protein